MLGITNGNMGSDAKTLEGHSASYFDHTVTETYTPVWTSDTTYEDYAYKGTISISGVTSSTVAEVIFAMAEATSGNYAPVAETFNGGIYIWGTVNDSITVTVRRLV